ncbi:MAG: hypothetical protein E7121_02530 [Bacteroidales bacterium]|nr:hypothetical protein [Bacteroidales bacterium]MBP3342929.1 hypothetical protein [Bacteroidales bacterium]MBQ6870837.1 hypothetical protein [Bacteroidales bacterium]
MKQIFNVAKGMLAIVAACVVVISAFSCDKGDAVDVDREMQSKSASLIVSIVPEYAESDKNGAVTKTTGPEIVRPSDDKVNLLELFVFRADGSGKGDLDAYKKLEGSELASLSGIELRTTTGPKIIYAVVNSHNENWSGVKTQEDFEGKLASLQKENLGDFTMVGQTEATLQLTTSVSISVSRLVARVMLATIKTDFSGTPYEGTPLKNVKVYLTNVHGNNCYASGEDSSPAVIFNDKKYNSGDVAGCACSEILYVEMPLDATEVTHALSHYFYCYENMIETESDENRFTRLVIEGQLNGNTYYYPININREGFGYSEGNGHKGVKRNTSYTIDVVICRPGSTDPDHILEYGTLQASINVADWVTVPDVEVEF